MEKREIEIPVGSVKICGFRTVPPNSRALVIFAHGAGSSRFSPRNNLVAGVLNQNGMATLLF